MRATLVGGTADAEGFVLTGTVTIVDQPDFGTPTGITYVDQVAVPLAQAETDPSWIGSHHRGD